MSYEIRKMKQEDAGILKNFFGKVYQPDHIAANERYLSWQYRDVPANGLYPDYSNLILLKDGEIAGHVGMIPYGFKIGAKTAKAAFLANLIVVPELRGTGAGTFLVREAEKYFDILYAVGVKKAAQAALEFCKWEKEVILKRWIYDVKEKKERGGVRALEIHNFSDDWDETWKDLRKRYKILIDRSSKYMNWRFGHHPFITYKMFYEPGGGCIILRKEDGGEFKAYRIVDFISTPTAAVTLLKSAINLANSENVDFLDFFCNSDVYGEELETAGFRVYNPDINPNPPVFILPIDRNRLKINFFYKFIDPGFNNFMPEDWLIVKSDGDKDRAW